MEVNSCNFNGKEYIETDRITYKDKTYAYLVNENDEYDFMVRIVTKEGEAEYYDPLSSEEEFAKALVLFVKNNVNIAKSFADQVNDELNDSEE